jgi:hypothetical protein
MQMDIENYIWLYKKHNISPTFVLDCIRQHDTQYVRSHNKTRLFSFAWYLFYTKWKIVEPKDYYMVRYDTR